MNCHFIAGHVVIVAEVIELHFVGMFQLIDFGAQRFAVLSKRPAVGFEITDDISVAARGDLFAKFISCNLL